MKHPAAGPLPGNRLPFLTFVLLLAMFFWPLIGSTTPTAVPQSILTQPWQTILNRSGSSLYPFRNLAYKPAIHAIVMRKSSTLHAPGTPFAHQKSLNESPFAAVANDFAAILETTPLWSSRAEMAHGRTGHSATLLPDGRVLVAGGWEISPAPDNPPLASAEIYNPADNTWSDAGSMATARGIHAATLLPDGRVLVTGGVNWLDTMYASAELYDPATNSWSSTGTMSSPRCGHTATLLPDDRVLVAGGYDDITSPESTNSVDLYNPATNIWSEADTMAEGRAEHSTALLSDGRVLVSGGYNNSVGPLASTEVYDPAADTWSTAADMNFASYGHTGTVLLDSRVLIAGGGTDFFNTLGRVEVYDPAADSWSTAATMWASESHTATLLPDGRVLVTGGFLQIGGYEGIGRSSNLASTGIYDPVSGSLSWVGDLSIGRANHTATLLPDGRVFVAGGGNGFSSTELFDPADDSWNTTGEMINSRVNSTAPLLPDGKVFMAGGWNENGVLDAGEVYDPVAKTWASVGNMANGRTAHTSTLLPDGRVLLAGGFFGIAGTDALNSSELFDSTSGTWSYAASFDINRGLHTATLLPNGKVLIAGGRDASNDSLASAELYDPTANTWENAAPMTTARDMHSAVLLQDGRVLVAGGDDTGSDTTLSSAEFYDPSTNSWSDAGQMTTPRNQFSMVLLPDGRVFVAGGWNDAAAVLSSAEVYDPATNAWSVAANMTAARGGSAMALLPDGRVLVTGGWSGTAVLSSAEVYDPATDSWSEAGNLITARVFPAASLLADGQVLVIGGQDASGNILASAELYDVGLGHDDAWRPTVASVPEPLYLYLPFSLSGSGFRGVGNTEASSGTTSSSATNVPLVQLRSGLNGQVQWLRPEDFSAASYTARSLSDFPPGPAWLTVFVNSIPSIAQYVQIALPYTVTAVVGENGRIETSTPSPAGVVPGSNGTVQFTFTADDHHHIATISGCGIDYTNTANNVASLTVTTAPITGNCTVNALFAINHYTVSAVAGPNGSLDAGTPSPREIDYGATAQFTFRADTGSHIASISGCGINFLNNDQAVTSRTETTEGITDSCTVNTAFAINTYLLYVDVTGSGTGAIKSGSAGIACPEDCAEEFEHGTMVSLTALPASRSTFKKWTGDCIGNDPGCTITMDGDKSVTAEFHYFPWPIFLPAITIPVKP